MDLLGFRIVSGCVQIEIKISLLYLRKIALKMPKDDHLNDFSFSKPDKYKYRDDKHHKECHEIAIFPC